MLSQEHSDAAPASERPRMQPINLGSGQDAELGEFPVLERASSQRVAGPRIGSERHGERCSARRRGSKGADPAGARGTCLCATLCALLWGLAGFGDQRLGWC